VSGKRWAAVAALAFVLWHGAALVVAPYPDSELSFALRPLLDSYVRIGYPDHQWTFSGPRPDAGRLVRYQLVSAEGQVEERELSEAVSRGSAGYFRWLRLYDRVATSWPELRESTAAYLCRRHEDARPRGIRFVVLHQLTISHEQYLHGVRATDPEALRRETHSEIPCNISGLSG
jgi:Fe-S-cluster formation regulator IscX/YfhJ